VTCTHARAACCWLCSDQEPWWREARVQAGLGYDPPNAPQTIVCPVVTVPCKECGEQVWTMAAFENDDGTWLCESCLWALIEAGE
jgi:hypothetical protein